MRTAHPNEKHVTIPPPATQADVSRKISNAFCPAGIIDGNPCVDYVKHIVFGKFTEFTVQRAAAADAAPITYTSYEAFEGAYASGAISPDDLKTSLAAAINSMLEPVRQHFQNDERAKAILAEVRSFKVTR